MANGLGRYSAALLLRGRSARGETRRHDRLDGIGPLTCCAHELQAIAVWQANIGDKKRKRFAFNEHHSGATVTRCDDSVSLASQYPLVGGNQVLFVIDEEDGGSVWRGH